MRNPTEMGEGRKVKIPRAAPDDLGLARDDSLPSIESVIRAIVGLSAIGVVVRVLRRGSTR